MNRYKKIMDRKDGMRPHFLSEISSLFKYPEEIMVIDIKFLTPEGTSGDIKWSEKTAEEAKKIKEKGEK